VDASRVRRFVLTWCLMICLYVYSSLMQCLYLINDEYTMLVFSMIRYIRRLWE
jgi:hypothetical protein